MDYYDIGKRIMDIFGSMLALIIFSPLMILAAIYIKIVSSDGPIFADIPQRSGKDGKPFTFLKFRSMYPGAHEKMLADPVLSKEYKENDYKLNPDPRLIPGAKFIRVSSIDEMPQFINVLLGDMSIVGPRAYYLHELIEQQQKFPEAAKDIKRLKTIKPGITGPWQVGGRSEIGFVERARMDGDYADSRSLMYDLRVILKTPYVVLRGLITGKGVA